MIYNVIEHDSRGYEADVCVGWSSSLQGAYDIACDRVEAFKTDKNCYTYKIKQQASHDTP